LILVWIEVHRPDVLDGGVGEAAEGANICVAAQVQARRGQMTVTRRQVTE
jgi:hypothetical protein